MAKWYYVLQRNKAPVLLNQNDTLESKKNLNIYSNKIR